VKSLKHTLTLLIASGIAAAALLTAVSLWGMQRSETAVARALVGKDVTADILPPPMYLIELRLVLSQAAEGTMDLPFARSEAQRLEREYAARVEHWRSNPPYGLESTLLGDQHRAAELFFTSAQLTLNAIAAGDQQTILRQLQAAHANYLQHRAGVDTTVKASMQFTDEAAANFRSTGRNIMGVQWAVLFGSAVLLIVLGIWARRSIWAMTGGEPSQAAAIANAVAQGDLAVRVPLMSGDSTSVMAALARMCDNLSSLVGTVRNSSDTIASGSSQIASGNADLSSRTNQQASGLQQTAASMEQLNSIVKHNAENARQAEHLARAASSVAAQGGVVVGRVVTTMEEITSGSKQIADIVGVIDDIAFQTNILALNAAVEAARAGEQGRGFAVVASEVQTLARRSASAAREIKSLIATSVEKVELGSKLASEAGTTMREIVAQADKVSRLVSEISSATSEQTAGIGQVSVAVLALDQATQQNAALVQQSAAAAEGLNELASKLVQAVSVFKLEARSLKAA
jgi:methyl-accepting chemotaxis protein